MSWSRPFDSPIKAPDGVALVTLRDAGEYVQALPRSKDERPEWQIVAEMLLAAAGDQTECEENNDKNA